MKARDYAARLQAATNEEELRTAIGAVVRDLAAETADLLQHRGRNGMYSVTREIDAKWRAICARCPTLGLNPNGWRDLLIRDSGGELAPLFERRP